MNEEGQPPMAGGRTSEERERARLEREARRAARRGEPAPSRPASTGAEAASMGAESAGSERPSTATHSGAPDGHTPLPTTDDPPARRRRFLPASAGPAGSGPPDERSGAPAPGARGGARDRPPARRRGRGRGDDGGSGGGRAPRRRGVVRRVLLAAALLLGLGIAGAVAVSWLSAPERGEAVAIEVPTGAGVSDIGALLERRGIVSSGALFELRTTLAGRRGDLRPGRYRLARNMGYGAAIDALATGPRARRIAVVNVTIPEGRSRREVAPVVRQAGIEGSYRRATVRSRELRPRRYGARGARDLEGFLFPATYEVRSRTGVRGLVNKQLQAFEREFGRLDLRAARRRNLTAYDVVIIASMVEREAQRPEERPVIASVIYNRLRQGIPLGIDATVRFVTGNWTRPLRESQLAIDSAYNTRARAGLPPGPIGNPGLSSLRAAARPARTGFLYYVVKPGACGEHAFSKTAAEFERDVTRYEAARERRGGKSPTDC